MAKIASPLKWAGVANFPGYSVSEAADVKNIFTGRLLRTHTDNRGRKRVTLCRDGKAVKIRLSRLVLESFVGPCPEGMECCHEDGNERNDALNNLRWDTHSANLMDRRRHGTSPCGEAIHTAKLTAEQVVEIRRRRPVCSLSKLAAEYGVSATTISYICRHKSWQHIPQEVA